MLWILSTVWLAGVIALALAGLLPTISSSGIAVVGACLLLATAVARAVGTLPVMFSHLNPVSGLTTGRIRALQKVGTRR